MIPYPSIDPDIVRIGPFAIRWYGLMYVAGFGASYGLVRHQVKGRVLSFAPGFLDSLYMWLISGLVIGARLGYVLFYNWSYYRHHLLDIPALWQGGMSFHGGLVGAVIAGIWCCRRFGADPWLVSDLVTVTAPVGIGLGRLGNFVNGELWGRETNVPWAMIFPGAGPLPRHPSQLYEFFLEGLVLFTVLWVLKHRIRTRGLMTGLFVLLYALFRFLMEFFRQPDPQLGFVAGPFTMGQVLSAVMAVAGLVIIVFRKRAGAVPGTRLRVK